MPEYRAIYKCRMCGEEYESCHMFNDEVESQAYMKMMCIQRDRYNLPFEHHVCKDGSFGFSDFIGMRKVEQ